MQIIKALDEEEIEQSLKKLFKDGIQALSVVLMHSPSYPQHELAIKRIAEKVGF